MNIKKQNREQFRKETCSHIEKIGGEKQNSYDKDSTQYILKTPTGNLLLTVRHEPSELHFIAGNFVGSEEKAKAKFGHWKSNYIVSEDRMDTQDCILGFKKHIEYLMS